MTATGLYDTLQRYRTLHSHRISSLPIVILMPHSSCNCRCIMCDIWKGNGSKTQLEEADIEEMLHTLRKLRTSQVLLTGGEALLHPGFFKLCEILRKAGVYLTLLSTGLTLKKHAPALVNSIDELIVSLDGPGWKHDEVRNIAGAFDRLQEGIAAIRKLRPSFPVSGRTVIHKMNFRQWPEIIEAAKQIGLDRISFLPADTSSEAFNREVLWSPARQSEICPSLAEVMEMEGIIEEVLIAYEQESRSHFISESPDKLRNIAQYYKAMLGLQDFPYKKCNAPWVSIVVEPDGKVRPCFFHKSFGNIHDASLEEIINGPEAIQFRRSLDMGNNPTCLKCVCSLNLHPFNQPGRK
jgi:Fe-coproporphyrin III synthase